MAKKEKDVKKPEVSKEEKMAEKLAKRKARQEALKNRPAEQRPNSKQMDVIPVSENSKILNYGYPVKGKDGYQGVVITSVLVVDDKPVSNSVAFVSGKLTVKSKKGHGTITSPKPKKDKKKGKDKEEEDSED